MERLHNTAHNNRIYLLVIIKQTNLRAVTGKETGAVVPDGLFPRAEDNVADDGQLQVAPDYALVAAMAFVVPCTGILGPDT